MCEQRPRQGQKKKRHLHLVWLKYTNVLNLQDDSTLLTLLHPSSPPSSTGQPDPPAADRGWCRLALAAPGKNRNKSHAPAIPKASSLTQNPLRRATNRPSLFILHRSVFCPCPFFLFSAAWGGRRPWLRLRSRLSAQGCRSGLASTGPGLAPSDRSACLPIGRASHAHAHQDGIRLERTAPRRSASLGRGYRPCDTPAGRREPNFAVGAVLPPPAARWSRRCVGGWTDGCNGQCPSTGV